MTEEVLHAGSGSTHKTWGGGVTGDSLVLVL